MNQEKFQERRSQQKNQIATVYNTIMGALILLVGIYFLTLKKGHGYSFLEDDKMRYAFSALCVLYGSFRLFRGLKKQETE